MSESLIPFALPCLYCDGGRIILWGCHSCTLTAHFDGKERPDCLYRAYDLMRVKPGPRARRPQSLPPPNNRVECYPACGHPIFDYALFAFEALCQRCNGTGQRVILLTPEEVARREAKEAEDRRQAIKWAETQCALQMRKHFGAQAAKTYRPQCQAKCRDGHDCRRLCVPGLMRCRRHKGGNGPTTPEGRAAIADSNRRRAEQRRQARAQSAQHGNCQSKCQNP